jgi:serine protease Do
MGAAVTRLPDIRVPDTKVSLQPACGCSHRSLRVAKSRQSRSARSAVAPLIPLLPAGGLCLVLLLATVAQAHGLRWPGEAAQDTTTAHPVPRPGYLGVSLRDLDATETTRLRTHASGQTLPDGGAMIVTVDRDAPAWSAGLRPRDIVLEVNGQSVSDVEVLRRKLRICGTGDALTLRVWRAGHEMTVSVVLGDQDAIAHNAMSLHLRPTAEPDAQAFTDVTPMPTGIAAAASSQPPPGVAHTVASSLLDALMPTSLYTGLEVTPLTPQLAQFFGAHPPGGLLVTGVSTGSPAALAGLVAGDVIVRAGFRPITTRNNLAKAFHLAHGGAVPLGVLRNRQEMMVHLQPAKRH